MCADHARPHGPRDGANCAWRRAPRERVQRSQHPGVEHDEWRVRGEREQADVLGLLLLRREEHTPPALGATVGQDTH